MPPPFASFGSTGFPSEILKEVLASILFSSFLVYLQKWQLGGYTSFHRYLIQMFLAQNSDS